MLSSSWEQHFMRLAEETAQRSKDPNTKVGACIVKDKTVLSLGYNGAPRDFPDHILPTGHSEDLAQDKNSYVCHAELNAILNYGGSLKDLQGASIYITLHPCHQCVIALMQVGIKDIIYKDLYHKEKIIDIAQFIANQCGATIRQLEV